MGVRRGVQCTNRVSRGVELTSFICRIDFFDLAGKNVDMHPYLVASITISNVDKLKIMDTVSSVPTNPATGHQSI